MKGNSKSTVSLGEFENPDEKMTNYQFNINANQKNTVNGPLSARAFSNRMSPQKNRNDSIYMDKLSSYADMKVKTA